ncbi:MAG TPA: GAF domain-containing SpoIIE family protein phosphatase [Candidatus Baltobacteraceae bacterium]|nr:GAF domain-containing SpoIIE family protein phosphatase [Candidatus Baltobacteraceae bacterium]
MQEPAPIPFTRLEREHRYLQLLVRAGEILAGAVDWHETIAGVCAAAVELVADLCILDLKDDDGHVYLAASAHRDADLNADAARAGAFLRQHTRHTTHPVLIAIATGQPILVKNVNDEYLRSHSVSVEHEQFMRRMRYRSIVVVPLVSATQGTIGALTLVRTDPSEERYDEQSLRFAEDLARRCGTAIAKAKLYEQTFRIATVFQKAALPDRLPAREGLSFDAIYEPSSEEVLVGGDWYDAFAFDDGRIAITVGDVLGHGIEAATLMSRLRSGLRAALLSDPDPANALNVADRMLRIELREQFTTALVALIDCSHETLTCSSAGHPGPLVWDGSGAVIDPFMERGLPLGLRNFGPASKTAEVMTVKTGSFVVFFTDGLLEWNRNIPDAWSRLHDAIARKQVREALHPAAAIRESVMGSRRHDDDVAVLTVRWDL